MGKHKKHEAEKPEHEVLADEAAKDSTEHPAGGATSEVAGSDTPEEHPDQVNIRGAPMPKINKEDQK